ncbi:MAG: protein jag [Sulfurovum sp.]|nr:protein jag [Sulfurovum sp.]
MNKIEAKTLEEAYALATKELECSITALDCEIVQYPSSGFLGLFAKQAIIVVARKQNKIDNTPSNVAAEHKDLIKKKIVKSAPIEPIEKKSISPKKTKEKDLELKDNDNTEKSVLDSFFDTKDEEKKQDSIEKPAKNIALQEEIEGDLKTLIDLSCFDIDTVEVDVVEDTAFVFIDGEDVALLIGKEGYRYNALSYLVSNWLQNKHKLYLKLEIAQFLASQQEVIKSYMEPVIEHVNQEGWGRTKALDGILAQIALEQLREQFPNKYVAIKRTRNGDRYILVNEFNKR